MGNSVNGVEVEGSCKSLVNSMSATWPWTRRRQSLELLHDGQAGRYSPSRVEERSYHLIGVCLKVSLPSLASIAVSPIEHASKDRRKG